jgi:hypothetical protein
VHEAHGSRLSPSVPKLLYFPLSLSHRSPSLNLTQEHIYVYPPTAPRDDRYVHTPLIIHPHSFTAHLLLDIGGVPDLCSAQRTSYAHRYHPPIAFATDAYLPNTTTEPSPSVRRQHKPEIERRAAVEPGAIVVAWRTLHHLWRPRWGRP